MTGLGRPAAAKNICSFLPHLAAFLLFAAITALFFRPWLAHLQTALIGPPEDNLQDFWNSWYMAVGHQPGRFFFTREIFFPEGMPLYYHSFSYPHVFAFAALTKVFGTGLPTLIALQNLLLLATFPLAGLSAFALVRHVTGNDWAGIAGGFVFAFNPWHVAQAMHHTHVTSIEFLPLFALAYLLALERKSIAWLAAAAALWTLNALACWYYLFYIGFFVVFHGVYLTVRDRALPRGWQLIVPLASVAATVLLLLPLILPMIADSTSPAAYQLGFNDYVADLTAFLAFPPTHVFGGLTKDLYATLTGNDWENPVYLGLVNVAAIAVLIVRTRGRQDPVLRYVLWGMLVFGILAMGKRVHIAGYSIDYVPLPGLAMSHIPILANLRTPSRTIVLVFLFLAIGVGRAVQLAWPHRHRAGVAVSMALAAVLAVADFYPVNLMTTPLPCSPGLKVVRGDPATDFGILGLSDGYSENNFYMAEQACHGRPIANGVVARQLYPTLANRLEVHDFKAQRQQLRRARIKYIVLHRPNGELFLWRKEDGDEALYRKTYPVAYDGPDATIFKVY